MKSFWLLVAVLFSMCAFAQDKPAPAKKPAAKKQTARKTAHQKPTREQIRRFQELEKKQKQG